MNIILTDYHSSKKKKKITGSSKFFYLMYDAGFQVVLLCL